MAIRRSCLALIGLLVLTLFQLSAVESDAQVPKFKKSSKGSGLSRTLGGLRSLTSANSNDPVTIKAQFKVHPASNTGLIEVTAQIAKGWHIYSLNQPEGAIATKISLGEIEAATLAGKFTPDQAPKKVYEDVLEFVLEEHFGTVTFTAPIRFTEQAKPADLKIPVRFFYQACEKACLPPTTVKATATYVGELKQAPAIESVESADAESSATDSGLTGDRSTEKVVTAKIIEPFDTPEDISRMAKFYNADAKINYVPLYKTAETTLLTALIGAFIGGFLLNLMPCVFPVLGIKVMGFVEQAGSDPKKIRLHGFVFAAGLVVAMWALAGFILFVKLSMGQDVNWGQQMGSPYFVAAIIVLLFLMGLNMAGVFEFGSSMTRLGGKVQNKKGYGASFLSGVLTTLIATPCSGPFLGAAMGYTLAQPPFMAMLLFTVLALGIALPYLGAVNVPVFNQYVAKAGCMDGNIQSHDGVPDLRSRCVFHENLRWPDWRRRALLAGHGIGRDRFGGIFLRSLDSVAVSSKDSLPLGNGATVFHHGPWRLDDSIGRQQFKLFSGSWRVPRVATGHRRV